MQVGDVEAEVKARNFADGWIRGAGPIGPGTRVRS